MHPDAMSVWLCQQLIEGTALERVGEHRSGGGRLLESGDALPGVLLTHEMGVLRNCLREVTGDDAFSSAAVAHPF